MRRLTAAALAVAATPAMALPTPFGRASLVADPLAVHKDEADEWPIHPMSGRSPAQCKLACGGVNVLKAPEFFEEISDSAGDMIAAGARAACYTECFAGLPKSKAAPTCTVCKHDEATCSKACRLVQLSAWSSFPDRAEKFNILKAMKSGCAAACMNLSDDAIPELPSGEIEPPSGFQLPSGTVIEPPSGTILEPPSGTFVAAGDVAGVLTDKKIDVSFADVIAAYEIEELR